MSEIIAQGPVDVNVRGEFKDLEQAAFEKWLRDKCPSGDAESVQRQWLESYEYAELLDDQEPECQNATAAISKRIRTVEYEPGWGWISRDPQGNEVIPNFRWASRSVARDVARQAKETPNVGAKREPHED